MGNAFGIGNFSPYFNNGRSSSTNWYPVLPTEDMLVEPGGKALTDLLHSISEVNHKRVAAMTRHPKRFTIGTEQRVENVVAQNWHGLEHREGRAMKSKRGMCARLLLWLLVLLLAAPPGGSWPRARKRADR